jgi:hypothetical protein
MFIIVIVIVIIITILYFLGQLLFQEILLVSLRAVLYMSE